MDETNRQLKAKKVKITRERKAKTGSANPFHKMTFDEVAAKIEGKRITVLHKSFVDPASMREEKTVCLKLKQYLPVDKELGRKSALVQFVEVGTKHTRTFRARDIVAIRN